MSDPRAELRAWLRFAEELGITGLLTSRRPAPVPVATSLAAVAPATVAAPVLAAPVAILPLAAEGSRVEETGGGLSPIERLRRTVAGTEARRGGPSAAVAPRSAAVVAPSTVVAEGGLRRMGEIPAELLLVPDAPGAGATAESLDDVRALLGECTRCALSLGRTKIVFGSGSPSAELMFVGEGPGRDEDLQGLPFVGKAGQLLTDIIKAIGMTRDQVYIANAVKCRPPENRTPLPEEAAACRPFLFRQLAAIRPKVVVALGKPATETLLGHAVSISALRGQVLDFFGAKLVPTFHPAYLLRTPERKREVWEDMKKVRDLLAGKGAG